MKMKRGFWGGAPHEAGPQPETMKNHDYDYEHEHEHEEAGKMPALLIFEGGESK
jgi:hypothetical protein